MNGHRGISKPIFLDEEILQRAIIEELPQNQAGRIAKEEGIQINEVLQLRLEYRNILKIDHLWGLNMLTQLHLNNNLIKKMEGLDHLINLIWLNLSFNNIEKIEGLESLRKLEVLNLSNNKISVIENMETLENLTLFCITNNHIEQLDNVLYLRKFKKLFTLNMVGNPISKEDDYMFFIAAHFPNLKFLDYTFIEEETRNKAYTKYQYIIEEKKCEELEVQQAAKAEKRREAELQLHVDAFVENLNGSDLFRTLLKDDKQSATLRSIPRAEFFNSLFTLELQMMQLCVQLFETGLAEHKRRETEVNSFFCGQTAAVTDFQLRTSQILANFDQQHRERVLELQQLSDPELLKVKVNLCNEEINRLCHSLMMLEFQLVSQLEDITKKINVNLSDMVNCFIETAQATFAQCRDLEDSYHAGMKEVAVATLEMVADDNEEDLPEDVRMLFTDKDTVMEVLATSHDNHLLSISDRESQMVTRLSNWKMSFIKEIQDKVLKLNRVRVSDIHRYMDYLREQLEELQSCDH
ncbi:dynein regulatory complex subunit 3 [Aulostomus maculatus]